jgi:serine/threonine protein kinase
MTSPQLKSSKLYNKEKTLGMGSFGVVHLIRVLETNNLYALKEFHFKKLKKPGQREEAFKEAKIEYNLLKNDIKNVVKSYGSFYDDEQLVYGFTMDYCPQNFSEYVEKNGPLAPKDFLPLFRDMVIGKILIILNLTTIP